MAKKKRKNRKKQVYKKPGLAERLLDISDRHHYLLVSAVLLLALVLRIAALFSLKGSIYFDFPVIDESVYHQWASQIAAGTYKSSSVYEFSPLPAYIAAVIYKIFSPDILYIRIMNIILGVFSCLFVYLIGKELVNRNIGLVAALIACLYEPFIFYSIVPLKASLTVFLFPLSIYLFLAILNKNSIVKALLLGLAVGLLLNVRPNAVVIIPVLPLVIIWSQYKDKFTSKTIAATLVIYVLGMAIAVSPFMIRNYKAAGKIALTTTQAGQNLYYGNNLEEKDPYFRPLPFASSIPFEQGVQFTIEASRRTNTKMSHEEASSYWTREVIKMALDRPGAFSAKISRKTLVLFNSFESGNHYHIGFMSNFVKFFKFPFIAIWLILPFGVAAMAMNFVKDRKFLGLSIIFLAYAATLVIFFSSTRMRLPLLVILIPLAVVGVADLVSFIGKRWSRRAVIYSAIVLAFFVIEFLPVQGTGDLTAYYNMHAIILHQKGFPSEAVKYWEESSRMNKPFSAFANISLAGKCLSIRDLQKADYYLDKIPDESFAAASKYELKGEIMLIQGRTDEAVSAFEKSLDINSGQLRVWKKLLGIHFKTDKDRAFQEFEKYKYVSSFYTIFQ
jgi:4-amino-4-deoxy-L-arabinose transferase-like glycosyltransferase